MSGIRIVALALIVGGVLALAYGGFSYNKKHTADLGPISFSFKEKERVNIPVWAGIAGIIAGVVLLVTKKN